LFASETLKKLGETLTGGVDDTISLISDMEDGSVKKRLLKLMMERPFSDKEIAGRVFDDNVRQIRNKWYKGRHNMLKRELIRARDTDNRELSDSLLREKDRLLKEEKGLFENEKIIKSDEVNKLILLGTEKGFLTYDDINNTLPSDIIFSEHIDDILMLFHEKNIEIVDVDKNGRLFINRSLRPRKRRKSKEWNTGSSSGCTG